jgi:Family of unknown function (DUF6114)
VDPSDGAGSASPDAAEPAPHELPPTRRSQVRHRLQSRSPLWRRSRRVDSEPGRWRRWRRTRPFWGGVFLILAGLELLAIPLSGVLGHGAIKLVIYIGIGGVFGILIGVLLIASGVLAWVNPGNRLFYGIAGVVLGILSFPASNLGGFFLGMLLAIIGGSLAFAWAPLRTAPAPAMPAAPAGPEPPGEQEPSAGLDLITGEATDAPGTASVSHPAGAPEEGDPGRAPGTSPGSHRTLAVAAMPLVLVAGLLSSAARASAPAAPQGCILGIICWTSPSPSPSSSPSPTPTATSPGPTGSPAPNPSATPSPTASAGPSPNPSPTAPHTHAPSHKPSRKTAREDPAQRHAVAAAGLVASSATSTITAGSGTLAGFAYQGVVDMPVAGGGTEQMMEFTASSVALAGGVTASVTQSGVTTRTTSPTFTFSGNVVLYATQLSGCLGPVCFILTPGSVISELLKLFGSVTGPLTGLLPITLTKVATDQPFVTAGSLQSGSLSLGFG